MNNHYIILEISESATPDEIKQTYRLLLQVWHPDRFHHNPELLAMAEKKTRQLNEAFDTLSNTESRQRYDIGLRATEVRQGQPKPTPSEHEPLLTQCPYPECNSVLRITAKTVGIVTCPTCRTTFRYDPERDDKWDIQPPEKDEFFTPARMAMLAIVVMFVVIVAFTFTKKSKIIVSNVAPHTHTEEHDSLPENEPLPLKEPENSDHAAGGDESASSQPAHTHTDEHETISKKAPATQIPREHTNQLEPIQRQMAQNSARAQSSPPDIISEVDLQQLKRLAAHGYASAQTRLGQLYANGRGVSQDSATARGWYEKAAAQGHAGAQAQLGQLYADGQGVPQDYKMARQWWEQAASQGNSQAQFGLGQLYANGRGVPQDYAAARGWYGKAAAQGHAWAQAQLGQLYASGRGVPQDHATARRWYEKAAAQGNAWAQAQLALL